VSSKTQKDCTHPVYNAFHLSPVQASGGQTKPTYRSAQTNHVISLEHFCYM